MFRRTNERDLKWLSYMESLSKKEWDKDSLTKKGSFVLEEIKIHIIPLVND